MKEAFEKIKDKLVEMKIIRVEQCHEDYELEVMTERDFDDAIDIVNQVAGEYGDGWIPIENGLPKKSGLVDVTIFNKEIMKEPSCITILFIAERKHFIHDGKEWSRWVTAWQPLPKPYKPEGE